MKDTWGSGGEAPHIFNLKSKIHNTGYKNYTVLDLEEN
jgi:hypothetical protein